MFNLDWLKLSAPKPSSESLLRENEILKKQLKDLLNLDETGFFIELDSLLKAILYKALILCKAEASFIALTIKDSSELDVRISNLILEEKMESIRSGFRLEYSRWKETESEIISVEDFVLLPLVRRHRMIGVIGLKLNSEAPDNIIEILPVLADRASASLESAILYERMFKRLLVLSNVFVLGREILSNLDLEPLVDRFLSIAADGTDCNMACLFLFKENIEMPYFVRLFTGEKKDCKFSDVSSMGYTDLIKRVRKDEKILTVDSLESSEFKDTEMNKIQGLNLKDCLLVPIKPRDNLFGIIQVANKKGNMAFSYEDIDLLKILGSQIAFVIQNAELFTNLEKAYMDTLSALTNAIDAKDSYTRGHSDRVTEYAVRLAKQVGMEASEIDRLRLGSMLHDIGKIGISEAILNKPGSLDENEYNIIKSHPVMGVGIIDRIDFLQPIVPIIRHHHERYDGKGYPDGLKGIDIPFLARIVCIADAFDAMTSKRPYREEMSYKEALNEISRCKGTQFDPDLAQRFIDLMGNDGL